MNTATILALSETLLSQVAELQLKTPGTAVSPSTRRVIDAVAATANELRAAIPQPAPAPAPVQQALPVATPKVPTPEAGRAPSVLPPVKPKL